MVSLRRAWEVSRLELRRNLMRPLFWILLSLMLLVAWGMSTGDMQISSGDATVGGKKAFITSQFATAQIVAIFDFLILTLFFAVIAGLPVVRDEEARVNEVLLATRLRSGEYIWGKYCGVFALFLIVLLAHVSFAAFFNHLVPNAASAEIRGPFAFSNYLRPILLFSIPGLGFVCALCFMIGTLTRKPILVFLFPIVLLVVCATFLWEWSPTWLDPSINRLLMWVDPSGVRWLSETWMNVDRGVDFYNHQTIPVDVGFVVSRLLWVAASILCVEITRVQFGRAQRGATPKRRRARLLENVASGIEAHTTTAASATSPLRELAMRCTPVSFLRGTQVMAASEVVGLLRHPGLYLFIPLIVLQVIGNAMVEVGAFDVELLFSSGKIAVRSLEMMTLYGLLLALFYTVESLYRERATGLASIHYATPLSTASHLTGKLIGVAVVALVLIAAVWLACLIAMGVQGRVPVEWTPFVIVFGLLGIPTFVLWCSFVTAAFAFTGSRMTTYAIGLGALTVTFYGLWFSGDVNWVWNWPLWRAVPWSDISRFEMNREGLLLNRLLAIAASVFFIAVASRVFPRREFDSIRTMQRLQPKRLLLSLLWLVPYAVAPLVIGGFLAYEVNHGFQGDAAKKKEKDYWRRNVRTFTDVVPPHIAGAEVAVDLFPDERRLVSRGHLMVRNGTDAPMAQFAVTPGLHWRDTTWTLDDQPCEPEDRAGLLVMTPSTPLAPGGMVKLGFDFHGHFPDGMTKRGGGASEFVLPSGVVLTSFGPSFVPMLGYQDSVGVDKENRYDAKEYADDFYHGVTRNAFGGGPPFNVRTILSGPRDWTLNGVGVITDEQVVDDRRVVTWESDHPVTFFNVVAGELAVREGEGTAIYYNPKHAYNIDEMIEALDGARRHYSEWFYPYPWARLKITEFPALASYAQGFASNISFSESIGFMTKSDPKANAAFMVTAHESAHQWWGNLLQAGEGPGGNILSEGMAHFSTALLFQEVKGDYDRRQFMKMIEEQYGERRQKDSERPLVKIDGSRPGDDTVTYDKGGWVFWMLLHHLGRERGLHGYRAFIERYQESDDHPVLQDFVAVMRDFATDLVAFDAFVDQWFFRVVVPEYRIDDVTLERTVVAATGEKVPPSWEVHARIENVGTGTMPVTIAVDTGEEGDPHAEARVDRATRAAPRLEARVEVTIAEGESADVVIYVPFEPTRLVVDPDVMILQLLRDSAVKKLQ